MEDGVVKVDTDELIRHAVAKAVRKIVETIADELRDYETHMSNPEGRPFFIAWQTDMSLKLIGTIALCEMQDSPAWSEPYEKLFFEEEP